MEYTTIIQIVNIVVFVIVLLASLGIGVIFSFRQKSTSEYVHGGRNMSLFPVSVSIVVTFLSAVTMQGIPAEVYLFGLDIIFILFSIVGAIAVSSITFLPMYYELKLTSVYQYLEMRYESSTPKLLGCIMDIFQHVLYIGILLYGTALALESLIGIKTEFNILAMALVCTIYTSLGGLRGVIWTDLFQGAIMVLGLIVVICAAKLTPCDITLELIKRNHTDLNINPSITQRGSVWIFMIIFTTRTYLGFCDQVAMVRYTALSSIKKANLSLVISIFFFIVLQGLGFILGIVIFVYYSKLGCGPLAGRQIKSPNELVPYFVTQIVQAPGFVGLFASAALSGTLSTASSSQNAIAAIFLKDIISPFYPRLSDKRKTIILKVLVAVFGVLMIIVAFIASYAKGTVFQVSNALHGITKAPAFGMFILGASFTFVSSKAAIAGSLTSSTFLLLVFLGRLFSGTDWEKPSIISESCNYSNNGTSVVMQGLNSNYSVTIGDNAVEGKYQFNNNTQIDFQFNETTTQTDDDFSLFQYHLIKLYSISPYAYHTLGLLISCVVGALLSLFPCLRHKNDVSRKLLFPFRWRHGKTVDITDNGHDILPEEQMLKHDEE